MGTALVHRSRFYSLYLCSYDIQRALMDHQRPVRPSNIVPCAGQRLIAIDAIVDVIFSFSTPRTIISLSQTCCAAYPIATSYFRVAYNPERFLQQFLPDPPDARTFRSLQAETGVVVYGKAVRNFLGRVPLTDTTEMVLSVDRSYAERVSEFLTGAGYDVENRKEESEFTKKGKDEQIERKIVLRIGSTESFATLEKARDFSSGACGVRSSPESKYIYVLHRFHRCPHIRWRVLPLSRPIR